MAQVKMVDDFVAELARLANCAVLKARQEHGVGLVSRFSHLPVDETSPRQGM
jgi:hypothetical protein